MASHSFLSIADTFLFLLLLTCLPPATLPQNIGNSPPSPTIADCGPSLLPLSSCAPFVQGMASAPAQACCDNLQLLLNQRPACLCLLLNDTALSSFPINRTLALQLPLLCSLRVHASDCSSGRSGVPMPPSSPAPQVSFGTRAKPNATAAASPMVTMAPRSSIMGFGFPRNTGMKLKVDGHLLPMVVTVTAFLIAYIHPYF